MNSDPAYLLLVATLLVAPGCSDSDSDSGTGPIVDVITIDDLVGSWSAPSHTYTSNANPAESFDLIANGGETRTTVLAGGATRTWADFGPFSDEWDSMTTISGTTLTGTPAEASRPTRVWEFTLVGDTRTLTDTNSSFDFTLADAPGIPATEVVVFVRQ